MQPDRSFLVLSNLTKSYTEGGDRHFILRDASLYVAQGEFIAILGKSGSGKTTLLNLVSGIDRMEAGEITLGGIRLSDLREQERTLFRRKNIGFIFQFFNLIPTLNVWENLTLPLELNGHGAEGLSRARDLLAQVGLTGREKAYPDRLSGGEQQRVAIARALVHDPLLVLADEPTGNLDEETGKRILDLLDRLTRKAGKNLIMVTHSPEAAGIADRVLTLHEGRFQDAGR